MKLILEISEETAACIWADRTWEGRQNKRIDKIVADVVEDAAVKYSQAFPATVARVIEKFRADENNREGPHFVLLGYSNNKGAPCAAMTVYAASAGRSVVESNGVLMFHDLGHTQISRAEAVQLGYVEMSHGAKAKP